MEIVQVVDPGALGSNVIWPHTYARAEILIAFSTGFSEIMRFEPVFNNIGKLIVIKAGLLKMESWSSI